MWRCAVVVLIGALALVGCTKLPPEVAVNDQVPADQRTESEPAGGGGSEGAGGGNEPVWVAVDIDFESAPSQLPAGDTEVTLTNNGAIEHNVVFDDLGAEPVVVAGPGETQTGQVQLEPGTYRYHCSVPGHEPMMNGEVTVE
ncbi:MAG: plastocyanin/azurin family copper-binding protein [Actinomycetota bacterium]|jgi:plastocyanin|nr:cupredoxin domain-containing protein [Euzebyaceae bacterium]MDQ3453449.1 plastocyanin/azurin family copper-binding protein [Actinomycetota bacterium]